MDFKNYKNLSKVCYCLDILISGFLSFWFTLKKGRALGFNQSKNYYASYIKLKKFYQIIPISNSTELRSIFKKPRAKWTKGNRLKQCTYIHTINRKSCDDWDPMIHPKWRTEPFSTGFYYIYLPHKRNE